MKPFPSRAAGQRGVALVVVLILLVVMTLLALAAMRGSILQERMSAEAASLRLLNKPYRQEDLASMIRTLLTEERA